LTFRLLKSRNLVAHAEKAGRPWISVRPANLISVKSKMANFVSSRHSCASATSAKVLKRFFGEDDFESRRFVVPSSYGLKRLTQVLDSKNGVQ
jgi:hypothetical protein